MDRRTFLATTAALAMPAGNTDCVLPQRIVDSPEHLPLIVGMKPFMTITCDGDTLDVCWLRCFSPADAPSEACCTVNARLNDGEFRTIEAPVSMKDDGLVEVDLGEIMSGAVVQWRW